MPPPLVDDVGLFAFRHAILRAGGVPDSAAATAWLAGLDSAVTARIADAIAAVPTGPRPSLSRTGAFALAAADRGAIDDGAGTFNVTVPAASTLGDPWAYEILVTSGTISFVGGQATVPVAASGGGVPVRLKVANGKVYLLSGTGATATWVA